MTAGFAVNQHFDVQLLLSFSWQIGRGKLDNLIISFIAISRIALEKLHFLLFYGYEFKNHFTIGLV